MADDQPIHLEGYAATGDVWAPGELEAAVARTPSVPLTLAGKVIGEARLSVDGGGLRIAAEVEPQGMRQAGVDEGVPYHDAVHTTALEPAARRGMVQFSALVNGDVSIAEIAVTAQESRES